MNNFSFPRDPFFPITFNPPHTPPQISMALARSKSAPHVAGAEPTFKPSSHRATALPQNESMHSHPKIQRHASALAVTSLAFASVHHQRQRQHYYSAHSGRQTPRTPRTARVDDPCSLSGFFPSSFTGSVHDRSEAVEWDWLHYKVDDSDKALLAESQSPTSSSSSGYASPSSSEDEEWALPPTPPLSSPMFDRGEDEVCGETIRREDKLGVLSLRMCLFTSTSMCFLRLSLTASHLSLFVR